MPIPTYDVEIPFRMPIDVEVLSRTLVDLDVPNRRQIDLEVEMGGLSVEQREKLNSVEFGARLYRPSFVVLASAVEKTTGGGSEAGGGAGDSTPWPGTSSYQEIIDVFVPQPAWRAGGYIEWDFTAYFFNTTDEAGDKTVSFKLQVAAPPPTTDDTSHSGDPSPYGLPQAFADIAGAEWTSLPIPNGLGVAGTFTFTLRIRAGGHVGGVFQQLYSGQMICSDVTPGAPIVTPIIGSLLGAGGTGNLDTTEDLEIRALFKLNNWTVDSNNLFVVSSASAVMVPRSGHPF